MAVHVLLRVTCSCTISNDLLRQNSLPIGVIPAVLFCIAWPRPHQIRHAQRRALRELDFIGCLLLIAASVLIVFAFQEGGLQPDGWGTARFIAPLVAGVVGWLLLFGWEVAVARFWASSVAAIFPLRLLKRRVYTAGALSTLLTGFPYLLIVYGLPLRFQVVNQKSALVAGIGLLPLLGAAAIGSMLGGIISGKKNRTFHTLTAGGCLMVLGTGLLSTLSDTIQVEAKTYGFQVFVGLGFGLTVSTVSMLAAIESEIRDHGTSSQLLESRAGFLCG